MREERACVSTEACWAGSAAHGSAEVRGHGSDVKGSSLSIALRSTGSQASVSRLGCATGYRTVLKVLVLLRGLQLKAAVRHALAAVQHLGSRTSRPSRRPRPCPLTSGHGSMTY